MTSAPPDPAIAARGLHRAFGPVKAVNGVDLEVKPGTITGLIGPNGSGKTTLMLLLAGLLAPDAGTIRVAGVDLAHDRVEARALVGWMPDQLGTWDALTCSETLEFFARAYGMAADAGRRRCSELLAALHLTEMADTPTHVLSRGQKQRLALARTLLPSPAVLLLDEPTSGLDPRSRIDLRRLLLQLASAGTAVLISSHVLADLDELVDSAVFLSAGRSVAHESLAAARAGLRGWRVDALDPAALRAFLASLGIEWTNAAPPDSAVVIDLAGTESAAEFVRAALDAGIALFSIAPIGGALEQAYLRLEGAES